MKRPSISSISILLVTSRPGIDGKCRSTLTDVNFTEPITTVAKALSTEDCDKILLAYKKGNKNKNCAREKCTLIWKEPA